MSRLLCSICTSESNLLRRELILSCAIINLFGFLSLVFLSFSKGSEIGSLNTSVDKKIVFSFYICEIVFHFSLLVKLKIFFSLVLFSLDIHHRSRKKLIGKKLNVDRQFFKDVLYVILLQERVGQYQFLGNCHPFPPFPFISTSSQMKIFIYSTNPFLLQPPSLPAHRPFNK